MKKAAYYREKLSEQRIRFLYLSFFGNFLTGILKTVTAVSVLSPLIGLNALYNFTLCLARVPYFRYNRRAGKASSGRPRRDTGFALMFIGAVIQLLGIVSILFAVWMLRTGDQIEYNLYSVYLLAFCTLIKLGMSIYWVIVLRARDPVEYALKLTNFADALFSLGLTQSALLKQYSEVPSVFYDGAFGVILGIAVLGIGVYTLSLPFRRSLLREEETEDAEP